MSQLPLKSGPAYDRAACVELFRKSVARISRSLPSRFQTPSWIVENVDNAIIDLFLATSERRYR